MKALLSAGFILGFILGCFTRGLGWFGSSSAFFCFLSLGWICISIAAAFLENMTSSSQFTSSDTQGWFCVPSISFFEASAFGEVAPEVTVSNLEV